MPGTHTVTVTPPGAAGVDLSGWVTELVTRHGRDDPQSQPDASTASLGIIVNPQTGPLPAAVEVGSVLVATTTAAATHTRFAGRITDLALGWDDAGAATPDAGTGTIIAAGVLADLGRRVVGDTPWPQELDGARVTHVMDAAGVTLDPLYSDPGTVQILARDVDSQTSLDVAQGTAQSASGVLWATRDGQVRYADANHRKGATPALTLDASQILVTPTWRRTLEGLTNKVSVGYGPTPAGGEQPRYTAQNDPSLARYGTYNYTLTTELAELADAQAMGQLLLVRNGSPVWVMADLPVAVDQLTPAQYEALLALDMHSLVTLTGLPAIGTAPTVANLWVEGLRERLEFGRDEVDLVVSGYCRTVPPPRWNDVDPAWLWGGASLTELRRNEMTNPQPAAITGWSGPGATLVTAPWNAARKACQIVGTGAGVAYTFTANSARATFPIGTRITISATVAAPVGVWFEPYVHNPTGNVYYGGTKPNPTMQGTGQPQRVSVSWTVTGADIVTPVNLAVLWYGSQSASLLPAGVATQTGDVLIGPTGAYFDGDTPDTAGVDYAWTGPPGASASTENALVSIPGGLPADLTWDGATCLGPPANLGRWDDQPATLRWDQVPATTTWNNYGA